MSVISSTEKDSLKKLLQDRGFIKLKGTFFHFHGFKTSSMQKLLKHIGIPEILPSIPELMGYELAIARGKDHKYLEAILEVAQELSPAGAVPSIVLEGEVLEAEDTVEYISSLIPVVNVKPTSKDHRVILLDPNRGNRPVPDIEPEVYMGITERPLPTLLADSSVKKVMTVFDPYTLKSLFVRESRSGVNLYHVNYYVPPKWRFTQAEPKYHGFIKTLIDHLFPNKDEREFVLDWMHYAIVKRNETVLCLVGARGTGKGILLKDILGGLVGNEYREIVNQEILTEKFNGPLKNKRYVFFDEVNISGSRELSKFRAMTNNVIALEQKGQDSETMENFTSLSLATNDKKDFRVEPQERRFSVPEITDTPLLELYSEEEIEEFCKDMSDPDSVRLAEFGEWLLLREPKNSSVRPLKGKYFFELCKMSMPEWKLYIVEYILHYGIVDEAVRLSAVAKKYRKIHGEKAPFSTKRSTIEVFLDDYRHEGAYKVGEVLDDWDDQRGRDTFKIVPDKDFLLKFGRNYIEGRDIEEDEDEDAYSHL